MNDFEFLNYNVCDIVYFVNGTVDVDNFYFEESHHYYLILSVKSGREESINNVVYCLANIVEMFIMNVQLSELNFKDITNGTFTFKRMFSVV